MGGSCKARYISGKDFFDDACFPERRYYLKNLYLKYSVLISRIKGFGTIVRRGAFSVVKKLFIRRIAFTLAEVLIVLGIIGLIADMTIPTLISSTQEKVTATKLKKMYSSLEQAYRMAYAEHGPTSEWGDRSIGHGNFNTEQAEIFFKVLKPYLRVTKDCGYDGDGCISSTYKTLTGAAVTVGEKGFYKFQLSDGSSIAIGSGTAVTSDKHCTKEFQPWCAALVYDVNGNSPPNQYGKDVFQLSLNVDKIVPLGTTQEEFDKFCSLNSSNSGNGQGCAAWIIYNGNMDYFHCDDLSWDGKKSCK